MSHPRPANMASGTSQSGSDGQVMESIRAGDPHALRLLMERYWERLLRFAARMLGSTDEAQDVAQEVFVRVWEHRARWIVGGSVSTYLYQIARNLVLVRLRHEGIRERTVPEVRSRAEPMPTPVDFAAEGELEAAVQAALQAMPARRREAFVLVRIQGLSLREAAEVMGVTRRTVANHLYMAVTDLQSVLRPYLS